VNAMKWVLKTSSIIVGTDEGTEVFRSRTDCPEDVRRRLEETIPGPNSCTIMITNREALEAIRSRTIAAPRATRSLGANKQTKQPRLALPGWQIRAGYLLLAIATLTGIVVWAMHSG